MNTLLEKHIRENPEEYSRTTEKLILDLYCRPQELEWLDDDFRTFKSHLEYVLAGHTVTVGMSLYWHQTDLYGVTKARYYCEKMKPKSFVQKFISKLL